MWFFVRILAAALLLLVLASFGGAVHPAADSLAVFRLPMAAFALLLLVAMPGPSWFVWPSLIGAAMGIATVLNWKLETASGPGTVGLYQKNLSFRNGDLGPLIADIVQQNPDVVTLQELPIRALGKLDPLIEHYPHYLWCEFAGVGGVAVLSRWPITNNSEYCLENRGLAAVRITGPDGAFWAVSLHQHWPWPYGQAPQRDHILAYLQTLTGPVVVAGDFNAVPWSATFAQYLQVARGSKVGPSIVTFRVRGVPLPLDHVIAPGGGHVEIRPLLGSDHNGVLARARLW